MMDKPEQLEQLTAYLDGELSASERVEVERLLAADEDARRLVEELRRTISLVRRLPREPAPAHVAEHVMARLERHELLGETPATPRRRSWIRQGWKGLTLAASLALVVTAGWLMLPRLQEAGRSKRPIAVAKKDLRGSAVMEEGKPLALQTGRSTEHVPDVGATAGRRSPEVSAGKNHVETAAGEHDSVGRPSTPATPKTRVGEWMAKAAPKALGMASPGQVAKTPPEVEAETAPAPAGEETATAAPDETAVERFPQKARSESTAAGEAPTAEGADGGSAPIGPEPGVALGQAGSFDYYLRNNVICNDDVRAASPEAVSNRVIVETDADNRSRLADYVEFFMKSNDVPDVRAQDLPEPIAPAQEFYVAQQPAVPKLASRPATTAALPRSDGEDVEIIMNLSRSQAEELVSNIQSISSSNLAPVNWNANGLVITNPDPVPVVVGQLFAPDQGAYAEQREVSRSPAKAGGAAGGAPAAKREAGGKGETPTPPQAPRALQDKAAETKQAGVDEKPEGKVERKGRAVAPQKGSPAEGGTSRGGAISTTAPSQTGATRQVFAGTPTQDNQYVLLALSLRTPRSPAAERQQRPPPPDNAAAASRPAATSQPTTRGAAGG